MTKPLTSATVLNLLKTEFETLSSDRLDTDRVRTVAMFARVCLEAIELAALEQRLNQLEN